jgi:hypothetical protein
MDVINIMTKIQSVGTGDAVVLNLSVREEAGRSSENNIEEEDIP